MSTSTAATAGQLNRFSRTPSKQRSGLSWFFHAMRLAFVSGPRVLFTSEISGTCGALMILLCTPSFLYCAMLTIPEAVFRSPDQHAYFYFSKVLNQDPTRWVVMVFAVICTLVALALPATMPERPLED